MSEPLPPMGSEVATRHDGKLWLVVRSLKAPDGKMDYCIKRFDVIKLGRVRFKVKDFRGCLDDPTEEALRIEELKEAVCIKTSQDLE